MYNLSTKALEGPSSQRRPTQAHEEGKGPKRRQTRRLGPREVFLFNVFFLNVLLIHESPRRPTAANEGRRRPTKREKGPNDARRVVWAIGKFFLNVFFLNVQLIHGSPRRPTAANKGRLRPTKMENGP